MNRTTETLFLRLDPALARTVRDQAKARDTTISALAEEALKAYINDTTGADHRTQLLQVTEEALLTRVEERFNRLLSNVRGLYAKEALDSAQTLELVKQVLALGLRDEKQLATLINGARQEAHKRISARAPWSTPIPPEVEAKLATLEKEKAKLNDAINQQKQQITYRESIIETWRRGQEELRNAVDQAKTETQQARWETTELQARFDRAIQAFEAQGMIKRKSIREILAELSR